MPRITELVETVRDAERWRKLLKLVGLPENGTNEPVTLSWDDATMTPFISIGYRTLEISFKRRTSYVAR